MDAVSARFGTLVIGLILARMMAPAEFGAFGVVVIALLGVHSVGQLGVGGAIISWRDSPGEIAPTVMTISVACSAALYAACYEGAPAFAGTMGTPAAAGVIRYIALSVVISGLVAAPRAMIERQAPRRRLLIDQVDNWLAVVVTIGLFATGHGLMSLAWGRLAGSAVSATIFIAQSPRALRPGFRRDKARAVLGIGLPFAASSVLVFAITNVDQIVVGHVLHARDMGFYVLALCLATWPLTVLTQQIRDMAPAAFARLRRGPQVVGSAFMSSVDLLACLTLPPCVLISTSGGTLIHAIYGPAWMPAAHVLAWLAPLAELRVFYALANDYFAVLAPSRRALIFQLLWLTTLLPCVVIAIRLHGMIGLAVVQVVIAVLFLLPWYLTELKPVAIWPRMPTARLGLPLGASAVVGLIMYGARRLIHDDALALAVGSSAALLVMGMLVFRLRTVLVAVRRAAAGTAARARVADTIGPALEFVFEPPIYPLTASPSRQQALRTSPEAEDQELSAKVRSGARWSLLNTIVVRVSNFMVGILLARTVFGPKIFGLYAVSQVVITILLSANELGIDAAMIRWEGDVRVFARTVFTLSVASSTAIYAVPVLHRPLCGQPARLAQCHQHAPDPVPGRDHRRLRLCPPGPAHPGVRPGSAHARRHPQLRGQHRGDALARVRRPRRDQLRLGLSGRLHRRPHRGDHRGALHRRARLEYGPGASAAQLRPAAGRGQPAHAGRGERGLGHRRGHARAGHARALPAGVQRLQLAGQQHLAGRPAGVVRGVLPGGRLDQGAQRGLHPGAVPADGAGRARVRAAGHAGRPADRGDLRAALDPGRAHAEPAGHLRADAGGVLADVRPAWPRPGARTPCWACRACGWPR